MSFHEVFMVEVFAGSAVLCSIAKQAGMGASMAIDKLCKRGARSTIFTLDLTVSTDQQLLEEWLQSPLLLWVHFAPVCGTASRARNIRRFPSDPKPLRSDLFPEGLPDLNQSDQQRVNIANSLFECTAKLFAMGCRQGVIVTIENPSNSYLWSTCWMIDLAKSWDLYIADLQVCMVGGVRDKWTRFVSNYQGIEVLSIRCDKSHQHAPWGFSHDADGRQVWATSTESQYPRKMCILLVNNVLELASQQGLRLQAKSLADPDQNPLAFSQQAQLGAAVQPRANKIPPVVPDFATVAVFYAKSLSEIPCTLMSKLTKSLELTTAGGSLQKVPPYSRLLRVTQLTSHSNGGENGGSQSKRLKTGLETFEYEVAFGLPWEYQSFIAQACRAGRPLLKDAGVPDELATALRMHVEMKPAELCKHRLQWSQKWLKRALELDKEEKKAALMREPAVYRATKSKRILLTKEILASLDNEDMEATDLLEHGASLAGEIPAVGIFKSQFKPCMMTMDQLHAEASKRNEMILNMTKSSGSQEMDHQLYTETMDELDKGWADGPYELNQLEFGATVSRRFPLKQGSKTRMVDDFSISSVNDTCISYNKIDLHVVDTFSSVVRRYFQMCNVSGADSGLQIKTYDLKSAYRQVPIKPAHRKYAYFSVYNYKLGRAQIYRLRTLPFGATHSVYNFLRLSRMIFTIATKGLFLLTTNFYDDLILASPENLCESAKNGMELVFLLTGWDFARDGKKATSFAPLCNALGVTFNLSLSSERVLLVSNTSARRDELITQIREAVTAGVLGKHEALVLRGRLGFADSFVHGRLGALALKRLIEHAYSQKKLIDEDLKVALEAMILRLETGKPRRVTNHNFLQNFLYTDASYETSTQTGGLGAVLVDEHSQVVAWFGIALNRETCRQIGADEKGSLIFELELLAAVLAIQLWCGTDEESLHVWFGDNDSVRYSLIRGMAIGKFGQPLMIQHLHWEALHTTRTWFARVPTEANLSDFPSRGLPHEQLTEAKDISGKALDLLQSILSSILGTEATMLLGEG